MDERKDEKIKYKKPLLASAAAADSKFNFIIILIFHL